MASIVTYKYIKQNPDIMEYIRRADKALEAQGFTEHSFAHVEKVSQTAGMILTELGYDERCHKPYRPRTKRSCYGF